MSIIVSFLSFILYFLFGIIVIYILSNEGDRAYNNSLSGLFAILLWPVVLIYKIYKLTITFLKH